MRPDPVNIYILIFSIHTAIKQHILTIRRHAGVGVPLIGINLVAQIDDQTQEIEVQVFGRSINLEDKAKFRPHGQGMAFISKRTGASKSGYWNQDAQQLIARILLNDASRLVSIDISSMAFQQLNNKRVFWAAQSPSGTLVFMDHLRQFWQRGSIEDKRINALNDQGSSKGFVMTDEQLYGINKNNQLWSYHLQSSAFKVLGNVSPDIEFLTDIQGNEILATLLVGERQEILELTFND